MNAVEFTTELDGTDTLRIPQELIGGLPRSGTAKVILLTRDRNADATWQAEAYRQFLSDDAPEDAIYDTLIADR
jgi:hypothetical protein